MPPDIRPVLVALRASQLGDLVTVVPALRALRRGFPGHRIVLAAPGELAPLARLSGAVDEVAPTRGTVPPPVGRPVDLAVNLHGAGPDSHRALDALAPRRRIGVGCPAQGWPGPPAAELDALHERVRWCRMLAAHGVPADPDDLRLPPPRDRVADGPVVVHPGAAYGAKRWPVERFAELARRLAPVGPVVVTGSAAERGLAERVAEGAAVLAGRTSIQDLAAVVAGARLVVSGDTGVAHLASAFGRPSVVLFGPVGPERWGPPAGPHEALTHARVRRGDPFADDPDPALLAIGVDEVHAACLRVSSA
ncbi:glycosyltransferase family 9 protein [Pseudonocardia oroxyli]|uniref:ADP-heptose:LPS heptosyltransferase n=1 Tax=Pseudonocardia oroxyli TaxID=366584 RepID=A0A1G7XRD3_PSEOR|nr:glycosyltransferase family 9 protein [Pseudonocardia oroxyli]SDG86747.1 ADP-heptose:LPS heptosyltransferase [Pseudonocardia oroxyli]